MPESLDARAKKVFEEVIDLGAGERADALDRLCGGDAALRARVEGLLAGGEKADSFLAGLTGGVGASGGAAGAVRAAEEQPGARIGPYKLLELIGEGGFGSVFLAEQVEPVRRRVALKIVKLGMDTRAVVARFEQERQALAMMDHPNIARVFDAGATQTGRPYFVMELVRGEPITKYCDAVSLSIGERLELFTQVCRAVQHAHMKGIIHRDIKPGNVLVSEQDGRAVCKVIDFGIAKATQRPLTDKTVFTEFRQFVGTPEYMSPEQASGVLDLDTRTDVYSLGVMLYELLAGVTPFDGNQLRSAAFDEIQRIIREVDPPPPSTRLSKLKETLASVAARRRMEPKRLGPVVRGELDWIVMRALEKDRARRYDSPGALATDVERYLGGRAVEAAPPSVGYRIRKVVARHRVGVTAAGLVAIALVAGLSVAIWQAGIAKRERDAQKLATGEAIKAKEEAVSRGKETERVAEFQSSQLSGIDVEMMGKRLREDVLAEAKAGMERSGVAAETIARRQEELKSLLGDVNPTSVAVRTLDENIFARALKAADEQFKDQPLMRARLLQTLADTLVDLGLFDRAGVPQREAVAIRRKELGDTARETLTSLNHEASMLLNQGKFAEGEKVCREVMRSAGKVFGEEDGETLATLNNLGVALQSQGKTDEAEPCCKDLIERFRKHYGPEHPNTLMMLNNMGGLMMEKGDAAGAEPYFRESLEKRRKAGSPDDSDAILVLSNLALCLEKQHKEKEAEPLYREAVERSRRTLGEEHFQTLLFKSNLGFVLCTLKDLEGAETFSSDALAARRRTLGNDSTDTLQSVHNMGVLRLAQGRFAEAEVLFREAIAGREKIFGAENSKISESRTKLTQAMSRQGKYEQAEGVLIEAERRLKPAQGSDASAAYRQSLKDLMGFYRAWEKGEPGKGHEAAGTKWKAALEGLETGVGASGK